VEISGYLQPRFRQSRVTRNSLLSGSKKNPVAFVSRALPLKVRTWAAESSSPASDRGTHFGHKLGLVALVEPETAVGCRGPRERYYNTPVATQQRRLALL
jgi:hypothetical protein